MRSDIEDLCLRVAAVEEEQARLRERTERAEQVTDLFGALDKDVADTRVGFSKQRQVLNAIGMTQSEHAAHLQRQSTILSGLVLEMAAVRSTQVDHGIVLNEHGQMLTEHGQMLKEQGRMLREVLDRLPA
ncbi:hypothetical protein [Actinoallomurus iriomotensis]|uniref:Uncharacterized protein n=1 Tax=Actinoallomurus iriomotensis TaxID=478107 RepID=A0A9W6VPS1_9ACTN|nr:hypothetical protein [Actinoallomurus iriomotensis]GLY74737.1 hypothetical protein Airi01_030040 [Actinoallomurus iriomotensis]